MPGTPPLAGSAGLSRAALLLGLALPTALSLLFTSAGCTSGTIEARTYDSIVARGLVEPSDLPPRPPPERKSEVPVSAWKVEDAKDLDDLAARAVKLLESRKVRMIGLGELYVPWWVPEHPPAYFVGRYLLPKLAPMGFKDLVVEHLTQDVPDEELRDFAKTDSAPEAESALTDFYAQDLLEASRKDGIALWKGGYTPARDRRRTLEDCAVRGAPAGARLRSNPHWVDITAEIKERSLAHLMRLRGEGKKALFFGGTEIAELEDEIDYLSAPAFESDEVRYDATRKAGALGADLRALGLEAEYACVFVLSPAHIQHQGRLNEEQYERLWRYKKPFPRLAWKTVGRSLKIALLLPLEKHRITSLESRVRAADDGE